MATATALPLIFNEKASELGIDPQKMQGLTDVINKYIDSMKQGAGDSKRALFSTPESQDAADAKAKEKKTEAKKMFDEPYPMQSVAFDKYFVNKKMIEILD